MLYQSFADLKAFRQTQTTKVAQIALDKMKNGHIVEKERYDFEIQRRCNPRRWLLFVQSYRFLGGPIGVLFAAVMAALVCCWWCRWYGRSWLIDVDRRETAVVALVQENNEVAPSMLLHQVRCSNPVLDVATVVAEIEVALRPRRPLQPGTRTNEGWT